MTKKRKPPKPTNGLWAVLLSGALVAGAIAAWVQMNPRSIPSAEHRSPVRASQPTGRHEGDEAQGRPKATAPLGDDLALEDQMVASVNDFLHDSHIAPDEARATKAIMSPKGELKLQFNSAFDRTYGSEEEGALVNGILRSLGKFRQIVNVQFYIGDEPMETLGHIDLTTPQPVLRDGA